MLTRFLHICAVLLAASLHQGCARASQPIDLGEHELSSCVFDRAYSPGPERGKKWDKCKDTVTFTARITENHNAGEDPFFKIYINERDDAAVAAFQERNMNSFSALRAEKKVLTLVAIFGKYSSPLGLRLKPEQATAFKAALK